MELPTEIIYEILYQIPFHPYIWILSKSINNYWKDKSVLMHKATESDTERNIDFVYVRYPMDMGEQTIYSKLIERAKYLFLHLPLVGNAVPLNLLAKSVKRTIKVIDLCQYTVYSKFFGQLSGIRLTNYKFFPNNEDIDIVRKHFPHVVDLLLARIQSEYHGYGIEITEESVILYPNETSILKSYPIISMCENIVLKKPYIAGNAEKIVPIIAQNKKIRSFTVFTLNCDVYLSYREHMEKYKGVTHVSMECIYLLPNRAPISYRN